MYFLLKLILFSAQIIFPGVFVTAHQEMLKILSRYGSLATQHGCKQVESGEHARPSPNPAEALASASSFIINLTL